MFYSRTLAFSNVFVVLLLVLLAITSPIASADEVDHHDHDHGHEGEDEERLTKILIKGTSDPLQLIWTTTSALVPMEIFMIEIGDGINCGEEEFEMAEDKLEAMEEELAHGELNTTIVEPAGSAAAPGAFEFHSNINNSITMYQITLPSNNCTAIFGNVATTSFLLLNMVTGEQVAIAYEEVHVEEVFDVASIAGAAMGGAIIVSLIPLAVTLIFAPFGLFAADQRRKKTVKSILAFVYPFMNAFGCGALLSVVALHLYPEMIEGLNDGGVESWQGGALVLGGIVTVAAIHMISDRISGRLAHPHGHHSHHQEELENDVSTAPNKTVEETDVEQAQDNHPKRSGATGSTTELDHELRLGSFKELFQVRSLHPIIWGITIGDALHNFVDGTIIATAFFACGPVPGWATIGAIVAHEIPKELGSIFVMLSMGASVIQAVFFNLLAQIFAILGCGIVLAIGNRIPESQTALLLAFGIGTFLFIALTDVMPLLIEVRKFQHYVAVFLGISLAFVTIGFSMAGLENTCGHSHGH